MESRDRERLSSVIIAAISSNPQVGFPMQLICRDFQAEAGALWLRTKLDEERLELVAAHNLANLRPQLHDLHFYLEDYQWLKDRWRVKESRWNPKQSQLENPPGDAPRFFVAGFNHCTIIESCSKSYGLISALQLYSRVPIDKFDDDEIRLFSSIFGRFFETFQKEQEIITHDRDAVNHEIARHLSGASHQFENARLQFASGVHAKDRWLDDIAENLSNAQRALTQERTIEGVIERRKSAKYESLRDAVQSNGFTHFGRMAKRRRAWRLDDALHSGILVRVHRFDLDKILSNLLENAAKYTKPFGTILCSTRETSNGRQLIISNQIDIPLSEEDLERIWRQRERADNALLEEGRGLGLPIVKEACDVYGIDIDIRQRKTLSAVWIDAILEFPRSICIAE